MLHLVRDLPVHVNVLLPRTAGQNLDHQIRRSVVVYMERAGRIQIRLRLPVRIDRNVSFCHGTALTRVMQRKRPYA